MASNHGIMYQQKIILRLLEQLIDLITLDNRNRRAIQELFRSVKKVVVRDKGLPDRLHPRHIPERIWEGRNLTDDILVWCLDVHTYYDHLYSSNLPR